MKWIETKRRQLSDEDRITLSKWKETIKKMVGAETEDELKEFVRKLNDAVNIEVDDSVVDDARKKGYVLSGAQLRLNKAAKVSMCGFDFL